MTAVSQDYQVPQAHVDPQDIKAYRDVMEKMARKDQWDSQGHRGLLDSQEHLERQVYLDPQVHEDPLVLQVPEVNPDHLQIWMPAQESRAFLGCQVQEDQKELWGFRE